MNHLPTSFPTTFSSVDQNWTNVTGRSSDQTSEWYSAVYILLISVLGILFNVFVLVVFRFHKKPCTVAEIYLSNLAAADLFVMSFLPFWAVSTSKGFYWPFGGAMCKVVNVSIIMNIYCSIYFLVLVSADRYLALVKPMSLKKLRTPKFAKLGCLLVWALGFIMSVPTLVYREAEYHPEMNKKICFLNYTSKVSDFLFESMLPVFAFIIPFPFISYCTWKIIQSLRSRLMAGIKSRKMEQRATTLMLAVIMAFVICWVPFHLVKLMEMLTRAEVVEGSKYGSIIKTCKQIFMNLAFFNSVLNPILYVIVGKNFRKKIQELICKRTEISRHKSVLLYFLRSGRTEEEMY